MAIEFWLSYNNGAEKLRLPVNPPSLSVSSPFSNTDIDVVNLGEFTIIGERGLSEYTLESFFPRDYNPSYCGYSGFKTPSENVKLIEKWRDTRKPLRLLVTGTSINTPVTIRSFDYDVQRAGAPGDIYYSMTLKKYEFLKLAKKVDVGTPLPKQAKRAPVVNKGSVAKPGGTYTVKKNDTLSKIAFDVYGKADRWRDIYAANKKAIGANPELTKVGQKLVLPK